MIHSISEFEAGWGDESGSTLKLMRVLTDLSLSTAVAPGFRTLGRLAWHITGTPREMLGRTGLSVEGPDPEAPPPLAARAIAAAYEGAAKSVLAEVKRTWTDATLLEDDEMYGERWKRGFTLLALVKHEIHHRAQMTVLMRQAGLKVPGIYGPALEEWGAFGQEPPSV